MGGERRDIHHADCAECEYSRDAAKRAKDSLQARRLLALAATYEGSSRGEAARIGCVTVQIALDWVVKFNAHGPARLIDRKTPRPPWRPTPEHRKATGRFDRDRADTRRPLNRALAADRTVPMELGGAQGEGRQAVHEPGAARHRLSQALCPASPSRPAQRSHRRF